MDMTRRGPIILQDLPVPFDRRARLGCRAFGSAGYRVAAGFPEGRDDPSYQVIDGVELHKHRSFAPGDSRAAFATKYAHSFPATASLTLKAGRSERPATIQARNRSDVFWPAAIFLYAIDGTMFVSGHHDLFAGFRGSRFPAGARIPCKTMRALKRRTHKSVNHVIATKGCWRASAVERGGEPATGITIDRTGTDPQRLNRESSQPGQPRGPRNLAAHVGVTGSRNGVGIVVRSAGIVVREFSGPVALRDERAGHAEFTGRPPDEHIVSILYTADRGLSPEPENPLKDVPTMNKPVEYMAFQPPVVTFDLRKARVSADRAGPGVRPSDVSPCARAASTLMDDESRRVGLGACQRLSAGAGSIQRAGS